MSLTLLRDSADRAFQIIARTLGGQVKLTFAGLVVGFGTMSPFGRHGKELDIG